MIWHFFVKDIQKDYGTYKHSLVYYIIECGVSMVGISLHIASELPRLQLASAFGSQRNSYKLYTTKYIQVTATARKPYFLFPSHFSASFCWTADKLSYILVFCTYFIYCLISPPGAAFLQVTKKIGKLLYMMQHIPTLHVSVWSH